MIIPGPDALRAQGIDSEAMMRGALEDVQRVRAAAAGGPDLTVTEAVNLLARASEAILTFLGHGPESSDDRDVTDEAANAAAGIFQKTTVVVAARADRALDLASLVAGPAVGLSPRSIRFGAGCGLGDVSTILVDDSAWPLDEDIRKLLEPYGAEIRRFDG